MHRGAECAFCCARVAAEAKAQVNVPKALQARLSLSSYSIHAAPANCRIGVPGDEVPSAAAVTRQGCPVVDAVKNREVFRYTGHVRPLSSSACAPAVPTGVGRFTW